MAEGHVAERSRDEARERIRLITAELARRSRTENLKAEASELRERLTAQAKEKASEKADELKARAKGAALDKVHQFKESEMARPLALAVVGGFAGALVGALAGRRRERAQHYLEAESIETSGYEPSYSRSEELKGRVSSKASEAKERFSDLQGQAKERLSGIEERAHEAKERAAGAVSRARERIGEKVPSREAVRSRADGLLREDPMALAFGALAVGAAVGLMLPLSDPERRALRSAHEKAKEGLHAGVEKAHEVVNERLGEAVPALLGKTSHQRDDAPEESLEQDVDVPETGEDLRARADEGLEPPALH
jgi:ElaB/YqjD/DUF883 family membrane-anchored ribosome-binding protein